MSLVLTDLDLLEAWTETRRRSSAECAEALLERALPVGERTGIAQWSLAHRNAVLLELRIERWSDSLEAVASCPRCSEDLELSLDLRQITTGESWDEPKVRVETPAGPVVVRLPSGSDLDAVASVGDASAARRALAERCVIAAPEGLVELPDDTVDAISEQMADADPLGALVLDLQCSQCGHEWTEAPDLVEFIADEAAADARRIAAEVHVLATTYGWSEADVLALPADRRRLYLELVED